MQVSQALTGQRSKGTRRAAKRRKASHASGGLRAHEPAASDGEGDDDDDDDEVHLPICTQILVNESNTGSRGRGARFGYTPCRVCLRDELLGPACLLSVLEVCCQGYPLHPKDLCWHCMGDVHVEAHTMGRGDRHLPKCLQHE